MNTSLRLLLSILAFAASSCVLVAQPFRIDENGNGVDYLDIIANPPLTRPLLFSVGPDPSGGILGANVLMYSLPYLVTPGDVGLMEPGQSNPSDLIRFYNAPGANDTVIIFYSDIEGPDRDLADVGIPAASSLSANLVLINETGAEGNNGATWTPASITDPGASNRILPVFQSFSYYITSDVVPEPGSIALLLGGVGFWFGIRRQRC